MNARAVRDNVAFLDEEIHDQTGLTIETPWDKEGADVLLIHNAGEILAWPENPMAFAIILEAAGISWTMSSELAGYDSVNYGLWYDDAQFARVAVRQAEAARKLKVKKIVLGECGHGHKASMVTADRILTGDLNIPRESALVLLRDIVMSGRLKLDPSRNDFPVTLHDPCNMVRMMGIVEPQREILRAICPQFREMTPHGVEQLLLRRRLGLRHHVGIQLRRLAVFCRGKNETQTDSGCLCGLSEPGREEVCLRAVLELQRPVPRFVPVLRSLGEVRNLVRRAGRTDRQCNGRCKAAVHQVGVPLRVVAMEKALIYFDNAATVWPKPENVYRFMDEFYRTHGVNPGRSGYDLAMEAGSLLDRLRKRMTKFFGGDEDASDRLVFGYNVTDALNLIIPGLVSSGDHVITTNLEHNSVIRPVNHMVRDHGAEATFVPFDSAGFVDPDDIARAMRPNTKLVIVNHGSNVIGTVQPVKEIGRICRERGVTFVVDTAQTAGIDSHQHEGDEHRRRRIHRPQSAHGEHGHRRPLYSQARRSQAGAQRRYRRALYPSVPPR